MTKTGQNVEIYQGDFRVLEILILDENDLPRDITNCTFIWNVYKPSADFIYIEKTTASGIIITNASGGLIEITLNPEDTATMLGQYNHECELVDPNSRPFTVTTGFFRVYGSKAGSP